jgi:hypothetical protein
MQVYKTQLEIATSHAHNPYVDGILEDPKYDKIPTGYIESHSYNDTDIEQDLINGD